MGRDPPLLLRFLSQAFCLSAGGRSSLPFCQAPRLDQGSLQLSSPLFSSCCPKWSRWSQPPKSSLWGCAHECVTPFRCSCKVLWGLAAGRRLGLISFLYLPVVLPPALSQTPHPPAALFPLPGTFSPDSPPPPAPAWSPFRFQWHFIASRTFSDSQAVLLELLSSLCSAHHLCDWRCHSMLYSFPALWWVL